MSEARGAAVAVAALIMGLVIGFLLPHGAQVAPASTITKTETVIETNIGPTPPVKTATITETETKKTTITQTVTEGSTATIATTIKITTVPVKPVVILEHRGYLDSIGSYHVKGVVQNQDSVVHSFVEIQAIFYDSTGAFLATDFTYSDPAELAPGEKGIFDVLLIENEGGYLVATYELQITYD